MAKLEESLKPLENALFSNTLILSFDVYKKGATALNVKFDRIFFEMHGKIFKNKHLLQ